MYGVPADLDLTFLHSMQVTQVCLGSYQAQVHFDAEVTLSIEGAWELRDRLGDRIDGWGFRRDDTDVPISILNEPHGPASRLPRLLGEAVCDTRVLAPNAIEIHFESGDVLRVFDDSERYESFQLSGEACGYIIV